MSTRFGQDFEVEVQARFEAGVWSVFCCWCLEEVMKLNLGRNSEARFDQYQRFAQIFWEKNICETKLLKAMDPTSALVVIVTIFHTRTKILLSCCQ